MRYSFLLLLAFFMLSACVSDQSTPAESSEAAEAEKVEEATEASGDGEIVIQPIDNQMQYANEAFTVKAGATVTLVMDNIATMEAMQHNVVILSPDADLNAIGIAAIQAGPDNEYVPDDPAVLFYTPLAAAGDRVVVEFTAPEPGEYPFICTFPGHYSLMKGVMTVVA
ncbi:MAG: plastocyanin/azurin family copper-binding protein [Bacteroidota bacterium]